MNLNQFKQFNTMGVINITPNSFSDPGYYLDDKTIKDSLVKFLKKPDLIFDFGFESTAPMNQAISAELERERFDIFFDQIEDVDFNFRFISFDTYRPQNFLYFKEQWSKRYSGCHYLFNDVSGVLDDSLVELLEQISHEDNFYYLFAFTHIPSRDLVSKHMNYTENKDDICESARIKFIKAHQFFSDFALKERLIFDPCFGFSKTYEQNWQLLEGLPILLKECKREGISASWLVGVSKKSFLRKFLQKSHQVALQVYSDPFSESEILHENIIRKLLAQNLGHLLFRVHDPEIVERAKFSD